LEPKLIGAIAVAAGLGAIVGEMVSRSVVKASGATGQSATFLKAGAHAATVVTLAILLRKHVGVFN
jgi:hypothetical protein